MDQKWEKHSLSWKMYMCLYVFERKKQELRSGLRFAGKPWCRLVFVWLGFHSRGPRSNGPRRRWALLGKHFVIR